MSLKSHHLPILILLIISLLIGIFTFQEYGMAWDEYLYYQYGDSIGYAYSIPAHLSSDFDINRAFEPSAWDHRNHGPAYLLAARGVVYTLETFTKIDKVALWHLVNFIAFLVGVLFFYLLSLRWFKPATATAISALYMTQPVLWGHAFINPKDPPFATAFIAAIYFGLRMVDKLAAEEKTPPWKDVFATAICIGLATNLRMIGPLPGVLLFGYATLKRKPKILLWFIPTALIAIIVMYLTWPYLWASPVATFIDVLKTMVNYPVSPKTLFYGTAYESHDVPLRYLPVLLGITLTEPVWFLFGLGMLVALFKLFKKELDWQGIGVTLLWFAFIVAYVLILRPPMYDNYRHFLFILPPVFLIGGFAIEKLYTTLRLPWLNILITFGLLFPGLNANIKLHPYEYAYYNAFVGGTSGAQGSYETDYWLTCYQEAMTRFDKFTKGEETTLIVYREAVNAAYYAPDNIHVIGYRPFQLGDYLLLSARLNEVGTVKRHSPNIIEIKRDGVVFCAIREIVE